MADQTINVPAAGIITVSAALAAGTTIANLSSSTDVWVSSDPSVAVGRGVKIGAYGSLEWQGGACYAVTDGSGGVSLSLSSSVSSLNNPVDIASAVANRGIPAVMTGAFIFDGGQSVNNGQQTITGVSRYANLSIRLYCADKAQFWTIEYWDSTLTHRYYQSTIPASFAGAEIILDSTVRGDVLKITWTDTTGAPANLQLTVYGSNRVVPEGVTNGTGSYGANLGPATFTQFTAYTLPGTFTTNGGMHRLVLDTSGSNAATATGMIQLGTVDYQGNPLFIEIGQITLNDQGKGGWGQSMHQENVILPRGAHSFRWQHLTSGASISYQISVAIYPG